MNLMLTEKQIRVLRYFRDYRREHGIAPTLDEAAQALGVSKITIHEHLNQLTKKGAIHRDRAKARAVAILYDPDAEELEHGADASPSLPLVGSIAAGRPIEALEDREDVSLTELVPTGDRIYMLRVKGKSMIEDHIDDGDLVVVERRETASDGDIVVAILEDEEATLKRFYRESNGMIRLQPANSEMEPLFTNRVQLRGVVRGVIRKFR
ncbi:MAG: transcriptional repressor LexA [Planctomycetota bacterium]|nr:transcriptional repressor LexA [Planctomycetota bacterium]MEC9047620.1 transcriptional repressor LexA [Planctomycetota bacterium]